MLEALEIETLLLLPLTIRVPPLCLPFLLGPQLRLIVLLLGTIGHEGEAAFVGILFTDLLLLVIEFVYYDIELLIYLVGFKWSDLQICRSLMFLIFLRFFILHFLTIQYGLRLSTQFLYGGHCSFFK